MANQVTAKLTNLTTQKNIRDALLNLDDFNLFTDDFQAKIQNMENIIQNEITNLRPDTDYKNSNVDKAFVGLENVTNDEQVKVLNKSSVLEATDGTNDTKWMTPYKTKEAIEQFSTEQEKSTTQQVKELRHSWLYASI